MQTKQHSDQVQLCIVTARSGSPQIRVSDWISGGGGGGGGVGS